MAIFKNWGLERVMKGAKYQKWRWGKGEMGTERFAIGISWNNGFFFSFLIFLFDTQRFLSLFL